MTLHGTGSCSMSVKAHSHATFDSRIFSSDSCKRRKWLHTKVLLTITCILEKNEYFKIAKKGKHCSGRSCWDSRPVGQLRLKHHPRRTTTTPPETNNHNRPQISPKVALWESRVARLRKRLQPHHMQMKWGPVVAIFKTKATPFSAWASEKSSHEKDHSATPR